MPCWAGLLAIFPVAKEADFFNRDRLEARVGNEDCGVFFKPKVSLAEIDKARICGCYKVGLIGHPAVLKDFAARDKNIVRRIIITNLVRPGVHEAFQGWISSGVGGLCNIDLLLQPSLPEWRGNVIRPPLLSPGT